MILKVIVAVGLSGTMLASNGYVGQAQTSARGKCRTAHHKVVKLAAGTDSAVIEMGVTGGNIRPWTITFHHDGTITSDSWIQVGNRKLDDPNNALPGLVTLASAEGFFGMQVSQQCTGTLPDVAARFVTVITASGSTRVSVRGGCNARFSQLWAVLASAAGIQS